MSAMDLRQLAALVAVAEAGSFSAAARRLHTVQSNVSTHVARLERELGATLVDRASGALTEEGDAVVARARRIQHELESLQADVDALLHDVSGSVRLGCIGTVGRWLAPPLFELVDQRHPKVSLVVVDATTTSLLPQLFAQMLDLAVVNLPVTDPDVAIHPLFDEDHVVIAPGGHPLAEHDRVTIREVARHELLLEPQGTSFRDELDLAAAAAGAELRPRAEVDGLRLVSSLAFAGFAAAIVPATAVPVGVPGPWRRVSVDGLSPRSVGLAHSRRVRLSAPARAVRDAIAAVVAATELPGVRATLPEPGPDVGTTQALH